MKRLLFILCSVVGFNTSFGQTTPNCTDISAYVVYPAPLTQEQINSINATQQSQFPNVVKLAEPTSSYNCHNYAFVKSEGGSEFWLNTPGDDAFWNDGSYVVTTNTTQANLKVSYQGDHSAVTTATSNQAISKWGAWGLYRHNISDVPSSYLPNNTLTYYERSLTLTGPSLVCTSNNTFTLNNVPAGATINWQVSSTNLLNIVSSNHTSAIIRAVNSTSRGSGWIRATVNTNCGSFSVQESVWVGKPYSFMVQGPNTLTAGNTANYSVTPWNSQHSFAQQGVNPHNGFWFFSYPPTSQGWDCLGCSGSSVAVKAGNMSTQLSARITNACGYTDGNIQIFVPQENCPPGGCEEPFLVYPNPVTGVLSIDLDNESMRFNNLLSESFEYQLTLNDAYGRLIYDQLERSSKARIDMRSKKAGYYHVKITYQGEQYSYKIEKR